MMSWSFYLYFADNVSDNINVTFLCVLMVNTKHGVTKCENIEYCRTSDILLTQWTEICSQRGVCPEWRVMHTSDEDGGDFWPQSLTRSLPTQHFKNVTWLLLQTVLNIKISLLVGIYMSHFKYEMFVICILYLLLIFCVCGKFVPCTNRLINIHSYSFILIHFKYSDFLNRFLLIDWLIIHNYLYIILLILNNNSIWKPIDHTWTGQN